MRQKMPCQEINDYLPTNQQKNTFQNSKINAEMNFKEYQTMKI
jgi:hypothetical protein